MTSRIQPSFKLAAKISTVLIAAFLVFVAGLQVKAADLSEAESTGLRAQGKIYVVIGVLGIIWLGIGIYLFLLERRIRKIEASDRKAVSPGE